MSYIITQIKYLLIISCKQVSPLIVLSINTPKPTKGLDALSEMLSSAGMVRLLMESLETGQNFHHLDGDIINGSVTWSTVADVAGSPHAVSSAWRREWGGDPTAGVARSPRVVSSLWWRRGSLREVRIRWFHSVGLCMVGQRHYDSRSCMAVASSVWCSLGFLDFLSTRNCVSTATSWAGEGW